MYIVRLRRRWFALHDIPADAQAALGKRRFKVSLETEDERTATLRAAVHAVRWQAEIDRARNSKSDRVEQEALYWRKALEDAKDDDERGLIHSLLTDQVDAIVQRVAERQGIVDARDPRYQALEAPAETKRFYDIATGKLSRLDAHLDEYLATLANNNERKTVDMKRATIKKFCASGFTYTADCERRAIQQWINARAVDGWKPATIQRAMSELRGYWRYLQSVEAAPEDALPFEKLTLPAGRKKHAKADERQAFTPADVVKLLKEARSRKDQPLADLIELGMWTGARIEELCALKVEKVDLSSKSFISIVDAKTAAGWRQVPVHSKLKPTLTRLVKSAKDGYVLSNLSPNKYGDRSNAIGKRFGYLKKALGFGEVHVFHSVRKTVATLLKDASVPEATAADILGHDINTMSYGVYAGNVSLETKREAIEKLRYPRV